MRNYLNLFLISIFVVILAGITTAQNNRDLYFVYLNTNPDKEEISKEKVDELQAAHLDNIKKLNTEGKLIAAGPFNGGGGMFILRADNYDQARSYLDTDPAIVANRFNIEIFPFNIYNGNLCGAEEPYEMVEYQFVRMKTNDENTDLFNKALRDTRYFMADLHNKSGELVVHGKSEDTVEGVLILDVDNAENAKTLMEQHPGVSDGVITYTVKTLWIAKGTFCE